jgi:hypothetical protein
MATGRIEVKDDISVNDVNNQNSVAATQSNSFVGGCGCGG